MYNKTIVICANVEKFVHNREKKRKRERGNVK